MESIEEKSISPVKQLFSEFITYFISATVVFIIGLIFSILLSDFTNLGRAGAIITLIAISMAYKDFYLDIKNMTYDESVKFIGEERLFKIWASGFVYKKKDELEKMKPGFSEIDALDFIENIKEISNNEFNGKEDFIKQWLKEMLNTWSITLRIWEFRMLITGTILWAFSDLLNNLFGW